MPYITDYQQKFTDLKFYLANSDQLKRQANGGNSILFSFPPDEEQQYIEKAKDLYADRAEFIDISKLLVQLIDEEGWDNFSKYYYDYKDTPHVIFHQEADPATDLFDLIVKKIEQASQSDKIPFLIRTGCLFGTGIDNLNIMENRTVINLPHPLVVFYPSVIEDNNLLFLNFKPASKYRCTLVK